MASNPMSLKQRLAALSANMPGIRMDSPPSSPGWRRKNFFGAPSRTRTMDGDTMRQGHDGLESVMSRVIFQAGVDYEVVMNASGLPDPREINYDELLVRMLSYLDLYVESDYTVVFFAAGGRHTPGWNWVWKAYRSLSRKYRKNLKKLFIVHSTFFTKMLFSLAGTIISPKFFRKITYITTLSELACHIPLTQIDIPPAVYQENLKHEKQITLPTPTRADLFGVPLEELMGYDGEKGGLPRVVKDCIQYLRLTGLQDEGLFRRSPNSVMLRQAQQAYDRGSLRNVNLRDLPTPLFPEHLYSLISRCPQPSDDPSDISSIMYIRETLMPELPHCSYILLANILQLMHEVSLRSATNRMDANNLAVVITPNLVSGTSPLRDVMMCSIPSGPAPFSASPTSSAMGKTTLGAVVKLCIQRYYEVFDEVPDRSEAIPQREFGPRPASPASSSGSMRDRRAHDDDEDIDDAMLVMPLGPSGSSSPDGTHKPGRPAPPPPLPYKPRTPAKAPPPSPGGRSAFASLAGGRSGAPSSFTPYGTVHRARSTISIERGTARQKGSISVGRGAAKRGTGAGVEATGITAAGFFSAPDAPPVPVLPSQVRANGGSLPGGGPDA
ncbi:uncharacterized protein B0H18DRAFT_973929 [Fomitopsis serialis]|uniref:uncharacterized protein n=1 Tax=Fomitopsis serialis TaxID=139415 RepID=UPI00200892E1|nr:uncharacterized protein B0H18DRAFT_973929 [Neoantrodia serialis]KAH9936432.1 hypothetical protein B0H18DRAFT_973929 [Neoantrodia serialis]